MKPNTQRVYELKGDLGDIQQLICVTADDVADELHYVKVGDTVTVKVLEMTKKEISQLEEY